MSEPKQIWIIMDTEPVVNTELFVGFKSAKSWFVCERPIGDSPIPQDQIHRLFSCKSKLEAIAFAEGRQSISGQSIKVGN